MLKSYEDLVEEEEYRDEALYGDQLGICDLDLDIYDTSIGWC